MTKDKALRAAHEARGLAIYNVLVHDKEGAPYDPTPVGDAAFVNALAANGYAVVPVEITEEMLASVSLIPSLQLAARGIWNAMLAAALKETSDE
jgi:hypothetical protein